MTSRIGRFDHGLAGVSRWQVTDETHLPESKKLAPAYAPVEPRLAEILRRPSLDERLPDLLCPEWVAPELMEPSTMSATRREVARRFRQGAEQLEAQLGAPGAGMASALGEAAAVLEADVVLDEDIRAALAALLKG
jgi:hypothetical protein